MIQSPADVPPLRLLGCPVHPLSLHDAVDAVRSDVLSGRPGYVVTLNPIMIEAARRDAALRAALDGASWVLADGAGVTAAVRLTHGAVIPRVPGIDLMSALCAAAARDGIPTGFYGGRPGIAETAAARLRAAHPGLEVAGCWDGYAASGEAIAFRIKESATRLLFVGLGSPLQEYWMSRHAAGLGCVAVGVGGSMDVFSGEKRRAPVFFRRAGMEWLYRLLCEPHRLPRMAALPVFAVRVMFCRFFKRRCY